MKSKLILYYEVVFNTLYYKYYKDEEKSRKLAFGVVRNAIGVIIFMLSIVLFVVIMCVFKLNASFLSRPLIYLISGVCLYYYYYLITKKFLKPVFNNVELRKEKPSNYYYEISVVLLCLFGGAMYVLGRLLTIYLCG